MERGLGRTRMSLILLVLGILATTAGVVLVGFGIWINDLSQLNTFILAGTSGVVGGFLLIGLWAVVAELHRVAEALRARQPVAEPVQPAQTVQATKQARPAEAALPLPETVAREPQPIEQPRPAAAPAAEASTPAVERMRAAI